MKSIPLKTYRLAPRKARIDVHDDKISIYLPTYFDGRRFEVPLNEVAVADLSATETDDEPEDIFPDEILLPYFFTTGPATQPTTMLLFRDRQRVPRLRFIAAAAPNSDLPFGYREARSDKGAWIDGMLLRAADPREAAGTLVSAGAERVDDVDAWLRAHRRVAEGEEREALIRRSDIDRRLGRLSAVLVFGSLVGARFAVNSETTPAWAWGLCGLGLCGALWLRWKIRLSRQAGRGDPRTREV